MTEDALQKRKPASDKTGSLDAIKAVRALDNDTFGTTLRSLQAAVIADRYRLPMPLARVTAELAFAGAAA